MNRVAKAEQLKSKGLLFPKIVLKAMIRVMLATGHGSSPEQLKVIQREYLKIASEEDPDPAFTILVERDEMMKSGTGGVKEEFGPWVSVLTKEEKLTVAKAVATVAAADGKVKEGEAKVLLDFAGVLGMKMSDMKALLQKEMRSDSEEMNSGEFSC